MTPAARVASIIAATAKLLAAGMAKRAAQKEPTK